MKIVQNALFRSCAGGFAQIVFLRVKLLKIVRLVSNSLQNGKTVCCSWTLYKTLYSGHAEHVLAKSHLWASKLSKSSHWPQILSKKAKQCAFHENCTKPFFQVMRSTFWPNRIFNCQSSQNRETRLKVSSKRKNSALSMKIGQNAVFRSCATRFGQIACLSVKVLKRVTLAWNSRKKGKRVRFSWKLHKTLFSRHAQHVLAKSNLWKSKLSKSSRWPQILSKTGKQCAFQENCTKPSFQVMRSTFWPNRICDRQSCQNRHTGRKFSPKRENRCAFHENCTKRSFQVMRSTFWPNRILERQSSQNRHTGLKSFSKRKKKVNFSWKLYKTLVLGHAQRVLPKSYFWGSKFSKSLHLSQIFFKTGKQCASHENCTKRSFEVMRSTFWPNRIFEGQNSQNRHTGLKLSLKRKNSALSMKIVQNALFRSCEARFGQIEFVSDKLLKIVRLVSNSLQNGKTARFHENCTQRSFQVMRSTFWLNRIFERQSSHWPEIHFKTGKQCACHENCTKRSFQVMRRTFWPNQICERQSSQNRHTGLKFSSKRENRALFTKIVHNALFRWCAARFGQIAFLSVKVLKIFTRASTSLHNGKTVRFSWKLYKTLFSGHAQHVLAKSNLWASKLSKSSYWPQILSKKGKTVRFSWKLYKTLFSGHGQHVLAKLHF